MSARPQSVTLAGALLTLLSLVNIVSPLLPSEGLPAFVIFSSVVLGLLGLIGAAGLWMLKRWALWLALAVSVLNILSAAPGLVFAPSTTLFIFALITVVGFAVVLVLAVLTDSRRSYS
jgi:uncharacterized membrane protein (DUF2068 family)